MRRPAVVVVIAGLVVVAVGLAAWAFLSRRPTTVGQNVFVNPAGIIDAYSTPSLTVNPKRLSDVVVAYREDRPNLSARLGWSDNGGATFQPTDLPLPAGMDRPFFPDAAFAPDGTLFVAYVNLDGRGNIPANLWLARSADGGRALSQPSLVATGMTFQPRLAVGPGGTMAVTWLQSTRMGQPGLTGDLVRVMIARSADSGRTWSTPAPVNPDDGHLVGAATPVEDGASLVVTYERFGPTASNLGSGGTTPQPDTYDVVVTQSPRGGGDFTPPVVVAAGVRTTQRFSLFFPQFPSLAAAPDGSLYLAWAQGLARGQDVLVARSHDAGITWAKPVRANNNPPGDGTTRMLPALSVSPGGRVDVVLIDQRNDPSGNYAEAYLASSTNGGRTFHDIRLSSAAFDTRVGPTFGGNLPPDLGSHLSLSSQQAAVQASWADSRLGTVDTGRQDIVTARVEIGSPPAHRSVLLGAAIVVLAATGGLMLLLARRRRADDRN